MAGATAFTLRPLERNPPNTPGDALEGAFRVHLSQKEQRNLGLTNGDIVRLSTATGFKGYAAAWLAAQTNPGNKPIAKVSDLLREHYDLALTDPVFIEKVTEALKPLQSVEISFVDSSQIVRFASKDELHYWIRSALVDLDVILPGCSFPIQPKGPRQQYSGFKVRAVVESIKPLPSEKHMHYFNAGITKVTTIEEITGLEASQMDAGVPHLDATGIGGLSDQIDIINEELAFFSDAADGLSDYHLLGPTTFLLHGLEGTGKTLLLERLAASSWQEIYHINVSTYPKGQPRALSEVFANALDNQPSLIVMDNLDKFLEKAEALVEQLRTELARLQGTQVVVAAAARSIYDVDASLRTTSGFVTEIELSPPNVYQRDDILKQILGTGRPLDGVNTISLAERLHGFVGRDIHKLCGLARKRHAKLFRESLSKEQRKSFGILLQQQSFVSQVDFDAVIDQVQPTVLKGSILEVPKVRWTDIAGVDHVRELLEAITVRPFKHPELDQKFGGGQSLKGVLLYGPPGCAKTLIAQAVATESKQNFLAVKGSELIKMYVGESERAIRDVFRRARAAKPCIIFFDEIDSIGKSREKTQDSGLNVVATLLNEMDGIEALKDVFIIGATNQPDILDSALIRTGRFDSHIHIGLPTEEARAQILRIHTRRRPLADDVDLSAIAARTEGSSGADISGLCSMALELAIKDYERHPETEPQICWRHFQQALDQHVPHTIKEEAERYKNWRPGKSLSQD